MPPDRGETMDGVLRRRAAELPNHIAFRYLADGEHETQAWTYAALDRRARTLAARLLALEQPGRQELLVSDQGLETLAAFFGCWYAGMIATPLAPPRPRQPPGTLAAVVADAGARVALTTQGRLAGLAAETDGHRLHWLASDGVAADEPALAADWRAPASTPADTAALLYTSGSTSQPKGVMLSHRALWGPPFHLPAGLRLLGPLTGIDWLPLHHIAGLNTTLLVLRVGQGTSVRLPAERVLQQPLLWLRAIARYQARLAGGPNFLYQRCVDEIPPADRAGLDLRRWWFAFCTAEPVRAGTLAQFAAAYASAGFRPRAFVPLYGLSEQQTVATAQAGRLVPRPPRVLAIDRGALAQNQMRPVTTGAPGAVTLVSNGKLAHGVRVRLVDPETARACAPGQVGEVWTASPYQASGYWNQPAATTETFGAHLAGSGEGPFLRTGDLGFLYEGELFICGRLKEMLIIRGQNYYVEDIEAAAADSHPDLGAAAAAFAVPGMVGDSEQVVLYHEVRPGCAAPDVPAIAAAVRRAVGDQLQLPLLAVVLTPAGALPRTALGKIQRHQVRADFLAQRAAHG